MNNGTQPMLHNWNAYCAVSLPNEGGTLHTHIKGTKWANGLDAVEVAVLEELCNDNCEVLTLSIEQVHKDAGAWTRTVDYSKPFEKPITRPNKEAIEAWNNGARNMPPAKPDKVETSEQVATPIKPPVTPEVPAVVKPGRPRGRLGRAKGHVRKHGGKDAFFWLGECRALVPLDPNPVVAKETKAWKPRIKASSK